LSLFFSPAEEETDRDDFVVPGDDDEPKLI
jgi:hypothetical protein